MADSNGNHPVAKANSFKSQLGLQVPNPTDQVVGGQQEEPVVDPQPTPTPQEVEGRLRRELERLAEGDGSGGSGGGEQRP